MITQEIKEKLEQIEKLSEGEERTVALTKIANEIKAYYIPANGTSDTYTLYHNIHTYLQSEMMLNACVSAEKSGKIAMWSCIFAAVAAIAACISFVLTLCLG